MRKLILFILFISFYKSTLSNTLEDSTKLIPLNKYSKVGLLVDLGFNQFIGAPDLFQIEPLKSRTVNIHYLLKVKLGKYFLLTPGIGLGLEGYNFERENLRFFSPTSSPAVFLDTLPNTNYFKSKLSANYFDFPIELRFRSSQNEKKALSISIGAKAGFLFHGKAKTKFEKDGIDIKEKHISSYYLNTFRYGIIGRIGVGYVNFFFYKSLTSVLKESRGPELNPITIGLSLTTF